MLAAVFASAAFEVLILYLGCQGSAALLQPVSDRPGGGGSRRSGERIYFLLAAAGSALVLFALSIAVVCASTNAAYFAG